MRIYIDQQRDRTHLKLLPENWEGEDFVVDSRIGDVKVHLSWKLKSVRERLREIGDDNFKDTIEKQMVFLLEFWTVRKPKER